tara:strand:+ start:230 stop:439 length:210 start_codon:yes stop_codon:yes gene_type:complete
MTDRIEIRDLNKGDLFLYNKISYEVTATDRFFYAQAIKGYGAVAIVGAEFIQSKILVKLIKRANETFNT